MSKTAVIRSPLVRAAASILLVIGAALLVMALFYFVWSSHNYHDEIMKTSTAEEHQKASKTAFSVVSIIAAILGIGAAIVLAVGASSAVTAVPDLDTYRAIINDNNLVAVEVWATWANKFPKIRSHFEALCAKYPRVKCVSVDADKDMALRKATKVRGFPTFVLIQGGMEVAKIEGAQFDALTKAFADLVTKPPELVS